MNKTSKALICSICFMWAFIEQATALIIDNKKPFELLFDIENFGGPTDKRLLWIKWQTNGFFLRELGEGEDRTVKQVRANQWLCSQFETTFWDFELSGKTMHFWEKAPNEVETQGNATKALNRLMKSVFYRALCWGLHLEEGQEELLNKRKNSFTNLYTGNLHSEISYAGPLENPTTITYTITDDQKNKYYYKHELSDWEEFKELPGKVEIFTSRDRENWKRRTTINVHELTFLQNNLTKDAFSLESYFDPLKHVKLKQMGDNLYVVNEMNQPIQKVATEKVPTGQPGERSYKTILILFVLFGTLFILWGYKRNIKQKAK